MSNAAARGQVRNESPSVANFCLGLTRGVTTAAPGWQWQATAAAAGVGISRPLSDITCCLSLPLHTSHSTT